MSPQQMKKRACAGVGLYGRGWVFLCVGERAPHKHNTQAHTAMHWAVTLAQEPVIDHEVGLYSAQQTIFRHRLRLPPHMAE